MRKLMAIACLFSCLLTWGVTREEMEHARAITAKQYLRYANNGSDYLDKLEVTSLDELEGMLKSKEKENLKAFKRVSVPGDYASWGKEQLVDFWSKKFFSSEGLSPEGKKARGSVARKLSALEVSEPQTEQEKPVEEATAQETPQPAPTAQDVEALLQAKADSLAALSKEEESADATEESGNSATLIYVVILAVLIAVVIGLVVYASKAYKQSNDARRGEDSGYSRREEDFRELQMRCERAEGEARRLRGDLDEATRENGRLRSRIAELQTLEASVPVQAVPAAAVVRDAREIPVVRQRTTLQGAGRREYYLSRADSKGLFIRADKDFVPGISVFKLTTEDGITGTFDILDDGDVIESILTSPRKTIVNAVSSPLPDNPDEVTGIRTASTGTAVYENGEWRVVRKARLIYC